MADSVEEVVYSYLTADASFLANFTGVYWVEAPEGTAYPYITYLLVDDNGNEEYLKKDDQGDARVQFDLWTAPTHSGAISGAKLRTTLREKVKAFNETRGGYSLTTIGITEQTIPRESESAPFHFVVDGIIRWRK